MYVFDSHSRDGSGMPSANGTAVLMQFDDIQSTVSFICDLADCLAGKTVSLDILAFSTELRL